jgi:hypothetical protein
MYFFLPSTLLLFFVFLLSFFLPSSIPSRRRLKVNGYKVQLADVREKIPLVAVDIVVVVVDDVIVVAEFSSPYRS